MDHMSDLQLYPLNVHLGTTDGDNVFFFLEKYLILLISFIVHVTYLERPIDVYNCRMSWPRPIVYNMEGMYNSCTNLKIM